VLALESFRLVFPEPINELADNVASASCETVHLDAIGLLVTREAAGRYVSASVS